MTEETEAPPGLAGHLQRALEGAHGALAGKINEHKKAHVASVLDTFEADIAPLLAPIVKDALDSPSFPDHYRALLGQVGAPEHFSSSLLIGVAVGAIIGPVLGSAVAPFVEGLSQDAWDVHPVRTIPVDVAVAAVLKNVLGPYNPANEAKLSGINGARFAQMVEAAGNSMGIAEAVTLERRGQLAPITLDDVLRYGNTNPKFYAAYKGLLEEYPSIGEVLTGWTKGHLGDAESLALYRAQGGRDVDYVWRRDSVGRPPGPMEVLDLWNRKDINEAQVDDALKASDLAPRFTDWVKQLRVYYPPVRSILPMLRAEAITPAEAATYWDAQGVPPALQTIFLKEAAHHSSSTVKQLTQAQIVASYETRLLDKATAHARLLALTYSDADATALLDLADEKRQTALTNATVNMVGRRYVAYKLSKADATHALATASVPNAAQLDLFRLWDIERAANGHLPSAPQIMHLYRQGLGDAKSTHDRLIELGIDPTDLAYFIAAGYPPSAKGAAEASAAIFDIVPA